MYYIGPTTMYNVYAGRRYSDPADARGRTVSDPPPPAAASPR
jgi:hypothetical protein